MLILHLVRHGETSQSAEGVLCGDMDPPLTDRGLQQAVALGKRLTEFCPQAVYASPMLRARLTAQPLLDACSLDVHLEYGLREIGYGEWEGHTESQLKEEDPEAYESWNSDPAVYAPPGGESGYAIAARALPVVDRIRAAHKEGQVVIVSHKATIRVITCALLGLHVGRFRDRIACPTASLTTFEYGTRGPMLVRIGETFS
jgi:broad specificity phosphatase PhoE